MQSVNVCGGFFLKMKTKILAVLASLAFGPAHADDHTPLEFSIEENRIIAIGEIDGDTLDAFQDIRDKNPDIKVLVLKYVGGSVDDEANVQFSRIVRDLGFTTIVPSDGLVASGGTDLFLAGAKRILEAGACVGVHSWAAEDFTATDILRSDPEHDRYLNYYKDIGIPQAFYWFTIKAAPADGMHWMTAAEVDRFNVSTENVPKLGSPIDCDDR